MGGIFERADRPALFDMWHEEQIRAAAAAAGSADEDLIAEVLDDPGPITAEWAALAARAEAPAFYQGLDWCASWMEAAARSGHPERARIVTVRERGRLVLVWPLAQRTVGPMRALCPLGAPATQYADILVERFAAAPSAFRLACRTVSRLRGVDAVLAKGVRADSVLARLLTLTQADWRVLGGDKAPLLRLTGNGEGQPLRTGRSLNALRRHARQLAKWGPVRYERVEGAAQEAAVAEALALKDAWLRERGVTSAGYLHPANAGLLRSLARAGRFAVFRLLVGEETAAVEIGLLEQGRYLSMVQSYDRRFALHAPGRLLLLRIFGDSECGIQCFDFMAPELPHKTEWTTEAVPVADLVWPLTRRGRAATTYLKRGRPFMVRAFKSLPPRWRERFGRLRFVVNA